MFTVLSNTRKTNLYLIMALVVILVGILSLAVVPTIAAPKSVSIPVKAAEYTDYYQRHPELSMPKGVAVDMTEDFYLRHPEWTASLQTAAIPVTGISESLDYFQRHPELRTPTESDDLSDYFLRH